MNYKEIEKKLSKANLGKTYLYVLINKRFDFYCQENNVVFFPNKVDAMVIKILRKMHDYEILKFCDLDTKVKNAMIHAFEKKKVSPAVILGYITSSFSGRVQLVAENSYPRFHAAVVGVEDVADGQFDLSNYLMEYILDDEIDERKVLEQLVFSNLCSDKKLEEAANYLLNLAKNDGINTDKNISIRHVFAYENLHDLDTIWGIKA